MLFAVETGVGKRNIKMLRLRFRVLPVAGLTHRIKGIISRKFRVTCCERKQEYFRYRYRILRLRKELSMVSSAKHVSTVDYE